MRARNHLLKVFVQVDAREGSEVIGLEPKSKCFQCGGVITLIREISVARNTWDLLKPLEPNADAIHAERHLSTQFQLVPPKLESCMFIRSRYGSMFAYKQQDFHFLANLCF